MKKSKNEQVQKFMKELAIIDDEKFSILQKLRKIVFDNYKKTDERMMYGGIMFSLDEDFGGVFVRKNHISFEFSLGYKMNDKKKLLEGTGKFRRHLKIKTLSETKDKDVDFFVKQAV
ncbi:MAG: DUF1801 domain-containing protein [Ignavibacteriae bacterium]|nr:DUF1801 domain-containing protein [Ignavibacteriota bacterium]